MSKAFLSGGRGVVCVAAAALSSSITVLIATTLCGCTVGPDYHPPKQPMPAHWKFPATTQSSVTVEQQMQIERWWTTFNDPTLDTLVSRALASNLDLQEATQRIRQARASLGIATAGLFPTVDVRGSYSRSYSARSGTSTTVTTTRPSGGSVSVSNSPRDLWQAGLDASWELDIFGGLRRAVEAANADVQASVEDRRDVLVTLLGEVATNYILLRGFQQEILIAHNNLDLQMRNAHVAREKKRLGTRNDLDIAQADAQVASTTADIASLESQEQQSLYALSLLLGLEPTALDEELSLRQQIPPPPSSIPVGLPSELLRRRPDIRRAERQLAAATAQIGVATADLFPRFSLTGTLTLQGAKAKALGNWDNHSWAFGPAVSFPLFDAGKIASNIEVRNAQQAQALIAYRRTVLTALQDVQNALIAYAKEQERRSALIQAVDANRRAVELATIRYRQGLTDYLNLLDAQRSLFGSDLALVQSNRIVDTNLIALYKALGGGWDIDDISTR